MATMFSQYIKPFKRSGERRLNSVIHEEENFSIDWFYYSPNTSVSINHVQQHVNFIQNNLGIPRINTTGLSLERPYEHLWGTATRFTPPITSPLSLDFSYNPTFMSAKMTDTLLALPPLRHGLFKYSWSYVSVNDGTHVQTGFQ